MGVRQVPAEVGGEDADGDHKRTAAEHGGHLSRQGPEDHAGQRPGQGGGGIDMPDENVGRVPGQHLSLIHI